MASFQGGGSGRLPKAQNIPNHQVGKRIDPLSDLYRLLDQAGVGSSVPGGSVDYMQQARQAYAPSMGYLDEAGNSARQQAAGAKKDVGQLYSALANDIAQQSGGIKSRYNAGIKGAGSAYSQAEDAIGRAFAASQGNAMDELKRLGITQAGGHVRQVGDDMRALLQGIVEANSLGTTNAMRQGRQAALTYNDQQGDAAGFAGAEAQSGIGKQLSGFLQNLAMQKAQLGSQINQYGLQLQGNAQQAAQQGQMDYFDRLFKMKQFEDQIANEVAGHDLDQQRLDLQRAQAAGTQGQEMDPLGNVRQLALQLYNNNPQAADNATNVVLEMAAKSNPMGGDLTLEQLMTDIEKQLMSVNHKVGDLPQLRRLAAEYMQNRG